MAIPGKQLTYSPSIGIGQTPSYFFKTRDPDSNDSSPEYPIYSMWINTTTKGIWYLESRTSSNGTVSALWRAVAPIVIATVAPTTADYQYPIGQAWINTAANDYYGLVNVTGTTATWNLLAAGGGDLQNLTPDSGGVINPISGTIQVTGYPQTASNIKGMKTFNGGTNVLQLSNLDALTPYVVGSDPNVSAFTTIQSAINAANADGGNRTVWIQPGTYVENITMYEGITLCGSQSPRSYSVLIQGTVTLDSTSNNAGFFNITVQPTTGKALVITSNAATGTNVNCSGCIFNSPDNNALDATGSGAGFVTINSFNTEFSCAGSVPIKLTGNASAQLKYSDVNADTTHAAIDLFTTSTAVIYYSIINGLHCGIINSASNQFIMVNCFGSSQQEIVVFNAAGSSVLALAGYSCSATSGYVATGAAGTVIIAGAAILGTAILVDPSLTVINGTVLPLSTDGTSVTAVKGSAAFDQKYFSVTNGFVSLVSGASFTWTDVFGAFSPEDDNGYFITATATGTLPASPSQGDSMKFFVDTTDVLTIQASGSQIIRFGSTVSSAGGTAVSTAQGDSVELTYRAFDTCWCAIGGFSGVWNLT